MGFARIKGHLSSRIGRRVVFKAPADVDKKGGAAISGKIIDEVWADPAVNGAELHPGACNGGQNCWGDYSFCGQLIRWDNGTHTIRLAYYRRRCGEDYWEYASQMTVNDHWEVIQPLLQKTLAMTAWFQDKPNITANEMSSTP